MTCTLVEAPARPAASTTSWQQRWSLTLLAVAVCCPKVNLIAAGGSAVRAEDFLLLSAAGLLLTGGSLTRHRFDAIDRAVLMFLAVALVSAAVGIAAGRVPALPALLYSLRFAEYWLVKLLWQAAGGADERFVVRLLALVTALTALASAAQLLGLSLGTSAFSNTRAAGLTAGPYEAAALAAGLTCFWVVRRRPVLAATGIVTVVLTQSRSTLVFLLLALTLVAAGGAWRRRGLRLPPRTWALLTAGGLLGLVAVLAPAVTSGSGLGTTAGVQRLRETHPVESLRLAAELTRHDELVQTQATYLEVAYGPSRVRDAVSAGDASSNIRFVRWLTLGRSYLAQPQVWLLGFGPSFAFAAVDGYYLRVLVETGVVGALVFSVVLLRLWRRARTTASRDLLGYLTVLLGTGAFIDIWASMKPMMLLWLLVAILPVSPSPTRSHHEG